MFERRMKCVELAKSWPAMQSAKQPEPKKLIGIEALLRWAYREELPKDGAKCVGLRPEGFGSGWGGVERYGEYLTLIDDAGLNRYGVVPEEFSVRSPHPDAIIVAESVASLDCLELGLPEGWNPFVDLGEMGGLLDIAVSDVIDRLTIVDEQGVHQLRASPSQLVFRQAIMGGCPEWRADTPEVKIVCGANGKPKWFARKTIVGADDGLMREIEVDGWCAKAKRSVEGAYRKYYLDPDPVDAGVARGEYEIWLAAFQALIEMLAGSMMAHEPMASERAWRPWESGERERHMLYDLSEYHCGKVSGCAIGLKRRHKRP